MIEQITKIRILDGALQYLTFSGIWKHLLTLDELEGIRATNISGSNAVADADSVTLVQTNLTTLDESLNSVAVIADGNIDWDTSKYLTKTLTGDLELFDTNLPVNPSTKDIVLIVTPDSNILTLPIYWKTISGTISTTKDNFIEVSCINDASQKQVDTITLTGISGSASIAAAGGLTKTITFDTDLTTTAEAFVTANEAAYLAEKIVLTNDGEDLVFTSLYAGYPFTNPTITNSVVDLAGTVANTTANISPVIWVKISQEA